MHRAILADLHRNHAEKEKAEQMALKAQEEEISKNHRLHEDEHEKHQERRRQWLEKSSVHESFVLSKRDEIQQNEREIEDLILKEEALIKVIEERRTEVDSLLT